MLLYTNLYDKIVKQFANRYSKLRVITGYSSAAFLSYLHKEFPDLEMDIYIGMAKDGVTKKDHQGYCDLFDKGIRVYYHIATPKNHQKVLDFYDEDSNHATFLGSANFSFRGLDEQEEVVTTVDEDVSFLFDLDIAQCLPCVDASVSQKIPLVDNKPNDDDPNLIREETQAPYEVKDELPDYSNSIFMKVNENTRLEVGQVKVSLIFDKIEHEKSGINSQEPYVSIVDTISPRLPENNSFDLKVGRKVYRAERSGLLNRNIHLIKENWRDIVCDYLKIHNYPITLQDLDKRHCHNLLLIPITSRKFEVKFLVEEG